MKTKELEILILFLCIFSFTSCDNEEEEGRKVTGYKEYVLTIAPKKIPGICWSEGCNFLSDVYAVKKENSREWENLGCIDGFEIEKGYLTGLVGVNGAGKSTLLYILAGFDGRYQGEVIIAGKNLRTEYEEAKQKVALVSVKLSYFMDKPP